MIYGKYAETDGQMSSRDLLNFLLNEQREEDATLEDAKKLIEKYEVDVAGTDRWPGGFSVGSGVPLTLVCFYFCLCQQSRRSK